MLLRGVRYIVNSLGMEGGKGWKENSVQSCVLEIVRNIELSKDILAFLISRPFRLLAINTITVNILSNSFPC